MDAFFSAALWFAGGVFTGLFVMTLFFRWVRTLALALGMELPDMVKPLKSDQMVFWVYTVLNPVPWLILFGLPYGIYRFVTHPPDADWRWFVIGAVFIVVLMFSVVLSVFFRNRRRKAAERIDA